MTKQHQLPTVAGVAGSHLPALDGLRGLAVLGVVLYHALQNVRALGWVVSPGWAGVDLFFVLSGFLITGILVDSRGKAGYYRGFYVRRALRIWPVYIVVLLLAVMASGTGLERVGVIGPPLTWLPQSVLFLQNFTMKNFEPWPIGVTWSLAIEEQFYLVWPLLVSTLPLPTIRNICAAVLVMSPLLRMAALAAGASPYVIYVWTPFRLDGLMVGAILAVAWRQDQFRSWAGTPRFPFAFALVGGFVAALLLGHQVSSSGVVAPWHVVALSFLYSAFAVGFGWVVLVAVEAKNARVATLLRSRFLVYLGTVSYCLYLVHMPLFALSNMYLRPGVRQHFPNGGSALTALMIVVELVASCVVASISWKFLEKPVLGLKQRLAPRS